MGENLYFEYAVKIDGLARKYNVNQYALFGEWLKGVFEGLSPEAAFFGIKRACALLRPDIPDTDVLTIEEANAILDGMEGFRGVGLGG